MLKLKLIVAPSSTAVGFAFPVITAVLDTSSTGTALTIYNCVALATTNDSV